MALPPVEVTRFIFLGNEDGTTARADGNVLDNFVYTGSGTPPHQPGFFGYQHYYPNFPREALSIKFKLTGGIYPSNEGTSWTKFKFKTGVDSSLTYPIYITDYSPLPCGTDPVPNPNGSAGTIDYPEVEASYSSDLYIFPRWDTDTPYSFHDDPTRFAQLVPVTGTVYTVGAGASTLPDVYTKPWTWDVTGYNAQSLVLNNCTDDYELYNMAQATTVFKLNSQIKFNASTFKYCCWNKGTVVRGTVAFSSVNVDAVTITDDDGDNWYGMTMTIGDVFAEAGTANWEFTIQEGHDPDYVDIPSVNGCVVFVDDFWITEIIPPA